MATFKFYKIFIIPLYSNASPPETYLNIWNSAAVLILILYLLYIIISKTKKIK